MTFRKNGRLQRIAYNWNRDWRQAPPERTNICPLFWLTVFAFFLAWPFIGITRVIGWIVRIVGAPIAFVFFGYKPAGTKWRWATIGDNVLPFVPIEHWWKPFGLHFMLGAVIVGAALISFLSWVFGYVFLWLFLIKWVFMGKVLGTLVGRWLFGISAAAGIVTLIYMKAKDTEGWRLIAGFSEAKYKQFCPSVEFK